MKAPLRKIVGEVRWEIAPDVHSYRELLECGHVVAIKQDIIGETNAYRRRCLKCAAGKPRDMDPAPFAKKESP